MAEPVITLSVVIGAYNEAERLPKVLLALGEYLKNLELAHEIIVVDDGSVDNTFQIVKNLSRDYTEIKIVRHFPNRGRGFSVREGVLQAQGQFILETDADGSVRNEAIKRFLEYFYSNPETDIIFGSRNLPESVVAVRQPILRFLLGYGFLCLAKVFLWSFEIDDFTLGFKMFRREAVQDIFLHQFDDKYVAEAEILFAAKKRGWRLKELPVTWDNDANSRVRPFRDSWRSLKGLAAVVLNGIKGRYT